MSRKERQHEKLQATLEVYQVLDSTIYVDDHTYPIHERAVRDALIALHKSNPSLETMYAIQNLVDAVLSQALNRDPNEPWIVGAKKVSGNVGQVK